MEFKISFLVKGENMLEVKEFITQYKPYNEISLKSSFFEQQYIQYLETFKQKLFLLMDNNNLSKREVNECNGYFLKRVILENDNAIRELINIYDGNSSSIFYDIYINSIDDLNNMVRKVKDIILIGEDAKSTKKHLLCIDKIIDDEIDKKNTLSGVLSRDDEKVIDMVNGFNPSEECFLKEVTALREQVFQMIEYYRMNYSVNMAKKKIKYLVRKTDFLIDSKAGKIGLKKRCDEEILKLFERYENINISSAEEYENWVKLFKQEYDSIMLEVKSGFSSRTALIIIDRYSRKMGRIIDGKAFLVNYFMVVAKKLEKIFADYKDNLNSIDFQFQKNNYWEYYTKEEAFCEKRKIYEDMFRQFKINVRHLNNEVRNNYSKKMASRYVNKINRMSDKYNIKLAKEKQMPIPKNLWLIRKYLWADLDNFVSKKGDILRKIVNRPWRKIVKMVAIKNRIIVEEEQNLDSSRPYIFVSTHSFTEDVIGLFSMLNRQAYMLMGTTDQIENNPLMLAGVIFGFFHVDRMDKENRTLCLEKQNTLIDMGSSFINYVGGSWENSENELQPLSFSGPYLTSKLKNALIVPVASYLVREDKTIYMRFGKPLDLRNKSLEDGNQIIRDTLASMQYKQIDKYSYHIKDIIVKDGNKEIQVHNLPYDQHIAHMNQVGYEYWNQPWTKPFAKEEIGLRKGKNVTFQEVYSFINNLSKDSLIKLSTYLKDIMVEMDEKERYDLIKYLDNNYEVFKDMTKKKIKKCSKK